MSFYKRIAGLATAVAALAVAVVAQSAPTIVSRADWKANKPVGVAKEHKITAITIHHTATAQKKDVAIEKKLQNLQRFSQTESRLDSGKLKPVWFDVPYHFYIAADGRIAEGREIRYVGDTNTEYDPTGHALIVVEGNFEVETPTAAQVDALGRLTRWLAAQYKVPRTNIGSHNDFAQTLCPGKNLKTQLTELFKGIQ